MSLTINFENNIEDKSSGLTGGANKQLGINIYCQIFKREQAYDSAGDTSRNGEIKAKLDKVIKCETNYELDFSTAHENMLSDVTLKKLNTNEASHTHVMDKNQIIVFSSKQGGSNGTYYTYYCYFKDNEDNVWVIYIPGKDIKPIIFDLKDDLEPTFEIDGALDSDNKSSNVQSIDTGNFVLRKVAATGDNTWETTVDLKNTSFNLAYDDTAEGEATITYIGVLTAKATASQG